MQAGLQALQAALLRSHGEKGVRVGPRPEEEEELKTLKPPWA